MLGRFFCFFSFFCFGSRRQLPGRTDADHSRPHAHAYRRTNLATRTDANADIAKAANGNADTDGSAHVGTTL